MNIKYDFHIHSALSPCGDADMTPNNIVNMALVCGLDMIAVADHNTAGNVAATMKVGEEAGIVVVPAMELETAEEIHVLCLFSNLSDVLRFEEEVVRLALPPIANKKEIFGEQLLMDEKDRIIGEDTRYLINATAISLDGLPDLLAQYNGVAVPAHVDKSTKSLVGNFGMVGDYMGFKTFELSRRVQEGFIEGTPGLGARPYKYIHNSDAHYLQDIGEHSGENILNLPDKTASSLVEYLKS